MAKGYIGGWKYVGKFSRAKGSREERALVQELLALGYLHVRRMPLSTHYNRETGVAKHHQDRGDVLAEKDGTEYSFELKTRNNLFDWVYAFKDSVGLTRLTYQGRCLSIGLTPLEAEYTGFDHPFPEILPESCHSKTVLRLFKLELLKKQADFLVIKSNRRKRLYFKFWG